MLHLVIAQYRSGGQNLCNWVSESRLGYNVAHEPFNSSNSDWTESTNPSDIDWITPNRKWFIKELWNPASDWSPILERADRVVVLYREDSLSQAISHLYSSKTGKYHHRYGWSDTIGLWSGDELEEVRSGLEENRRQILHFATEMGIPSISYERLYYGDGIQALKALFGWESVYPFPYGSKYYGGWDKLL